MKHFKYFGEITDIYENEDFHALDYWVVRNYVVTGVDDLYYKELRDYLFFWYQLFINGLSEKPKNTSEIRYQSSPFTLGFPAIKSLR